MNDQTLIDIELIQKLIQGNKNLWFQLHNIDLLYKDENVYKYKVSIKNKVNGIIFSCRFQNDIKTSDRKYERTNGNMVELERIS